MNRILVPIDFSPASANALRFASELSKRKKMKLTLLYCYPFTKHERKYDFGEVPYEKGIEQMLKDFYQENVGKEGDKTIFLARMGSTVDKVIHISFGYRVIIVSGNDYKTAYQRWLGSKAGTIASNARCPVLVVPPNTTFEEWSNVWHIKRNLNDAKNISYWIKKNELGPIKIKEKASNQTTFTSVLWESMVSYIRAPKEELRQSILKAHSKEKINLIILVSQTNDTFQKFLDDKAMQIIFEFGIPVMIFQAKLV